MLNDALEIKISKYTVIVDTLNNFGGAGFKVEHWHARWYFHIVSRFYYTGYSIQGIYYLSNYAGSLVMGK